MATDGFEPDEKVDLSALARLSHDLYTVTPTTAPTEAFHLTSNERAGILNHRFGPRTAPAAPVAAEMDFGTGQIDLSALNLSGQTEAATVKAAAPKGPTKTFGG